jgi:hypothetical protein
VKLADASGRNVWWRHWDAFEVPADWKTLRMFSREIEFAWGPAGGGGLAKLGAVELVIAAGPGGAGTVWIGDLRIEDRTYHGTPQVRASSARPACGPECVLDGDPGTSWRSAPASGTHRLEIDFQEEREYGGLVVQWYPGATPRAFRVEISTDGSTWTTVHTAEATGVERSYIYLPGTASRFVRLDLEAASVDGCGITDIAVQPFEFSRSTNAFFDTSRANRAASGGLPANRNCWTPIGVPDGNTCAIMNEEGMVEVDRGTFSIEPFVYLDGRLITWADADIEVALEDGWIPVPSSVWRCGDITLRTTAFAGRTTACVLYLRYRSRRRGTSAGGPDVRGRPPVPGESAVAGVRRTRRDAAGCAAGVEWA